MGLSRRQFLASSSVAAIGAVAFKGQRAMANPLGLPLGIQLYSVREMLAKDYLGTLKQLSAIGYREVESAGYFGHSPSEVKDAMKTAGLNLVSSHHPSDALVKSFDEILAYDKEVGVKYVICASPGIKDPARLKDDSRRTRIESFTMEDYRWNAENFNAWGRKVKAAGMQFGYHNHTMEFAAKDGVVPMKEMIRLTDPELVTFELDCGWVVVGGGDPAAYLREYPKRISMLHVKDFKPTGKPMSVLDPPPAAELGTGTADYKSIFAAAKGGEIRHAFIEQEGYDMPPMEALKIDAEYFIGLK
jgi:sugar phosphate isomerase/epimerase